jgi:hypothetical protein
MRRGEIKTEGEKVGRNRKWHEVTYQSRTPQTQDELTTIVSWKKQATKSKIRWNLAARQRRIQDHPAGPTT